MLWRTGKGWESRQRFPIQAEAVEVRRLIRSMSPSPFVEVGAGPGTFTADLPGWGIALDQSEVALRVVRSGPADTPVVRGDALRLPVRDRAVARVFAAHIYGLLTEEERRPFLSEARRIAEELVVVDAGRPPNVPAEHWQRRTLGGEYLQSLSVAISMLRRSQPRLTDDLCSQGAST